MENYELTADEVVLYHGQVALLSDGKESKVSKMKKVETELVLTNLNFVFITKTKQVFKQEKVETEICSADTVKFYRDAPHILKKGTIVEVYFKGGEKFIEFPDKKQARVFGDTALRLVSGHSKFVRGVKKAQKEIKETEEALDVDITGIAKTAVGVATEVAIGAPTAGKGAVNKLSFFAKILKKKSDEKKALPENSQDRIEKLTQLKEMLDNGTITQEEFEALKKECLE